MKTMEYAENIVWALLFFSILWFMSGWAKAWAIVPLFFIKCDQTRL